MFKERRRTFKKNMAFLVVVAFIFAVFPDVTHAATKPSSDSIPFLEKSIPMISAFFSFVSLNLSTSVYDLALFSSLSSGKPDTKVEINPNKSKGKSSNYSQKQKNSAKSLGNPTSQKPPTSKDDD